MAKDSRSVSPALDCLDLGFDHVAEESQDHQSKVTSAGKQHASSIEACSRLSADLEATAKTVEHRDSKVKVEHDGNGKEGIDELDPLDMNCVDPHAHEVHLGQAINQETILGAEEDETQFSRDSNLDASDQKIGPPVLSPYLQINQIDPSSKRSLFVRKWQPKEDGGTLHLREQQEQKEGPSTWTQKTRRFLRETLGQLGSLLPKEGQKALLDDIRNFLTHNLTESDLALRIKALVDAYEIIVPLDDGTGLHPWRNTQSSSSSTHRSDPNTPSSDVAPSPGGMAGKRSRPVEEEKRGAEAGGREEGARGGKLPKVREGREGGGVEGMKSAQLMESALSRHLTEAVNKVSKPAMPINIRVVGEKISTAGGYLHRSKAIFAFQKVAEDKEIIVFAMYTNEYGSESQAPNAGRIYLECIDSVPLRPHESGEERDAVIRAILCSYFDFMRRCGFQYVHARVPPPNDVSCQIFARRPAHLRVQSAVWMTRFMRRMLRHAAQTNVIHRFNSGSHGRILNYPPTVLPSQHLLMEIVFAEKEDKLCAGHPPAVLELLRERMFVVELQPHPDHQTRAADRAKPLPLTFAASRRDLTMALMNDRLAFHTVPHAVRSTLSILGRLIDEQTRGPQVGERAAGAGRAVRHWLDERQDMPPPAPPLRLQLSKVKRQGMEVGQEELTPAEDNCTSALEEELMQYNTWGKGGGGANWMGGHMEVDDEGSRGGQIHHQELNDLGGGSDHVSLFNMEHFD